jgi:agmatinase
METVPHNFLGLDTTHSDYDGARFAVLPVPYDSTACYRGGTRHGPAAVITASQQLEWFDEELSRECHACGIATLDPVEPIMAGPEQMHEVLYKHARRVVKDGKFLLGLGGEHGITAAFVRAVMSRHKKLSVLQLDAHCDLRDAYQGTRYSHASVMRRVIELGASIVPVGIRNVSLEEHRYIKRHRIEPITAYQCYCEGEWTFDVVDRLGEAVYVTIDMDAFDPAYAPGVGTPEPGGLDWYQVTGLLRRVAAEKNIVAADIVEVAPIPGQVVTEYLAARLAYKLMAYVQEASPKGVPAR